MRYWILRLKKALAIRYLLYEKFDIVNNACFLAALKYEATSRVVRNVGVVQQTVSKEGKGWPSIVPPQVDYVINLAISCVIGWYKLTGGELWHMFTMAALEIIPLAHPFQVPSILQCYLQDLRGGLK